MAVLFLDRQTSAQGFQKILLDLHDRIVVEHQCSTLKVKIQAPKTQICRSDRGNTVIADKGFRVHEALLKFVDLDPGFNQVPVIGAGRHVDQPSVPFVGRHDADVHTSFRGQRQSGYHTVVHDEIGRVDMEKKAKEIGRCKRELKKADKRVAELEKILTKLYEDAALGKISEERYQSMAAAYEREQGVLKDQREALSAEIAQGEEVYQNVEYFLPLIQKYTDITELNAHILNELIEKIVVHEKQIDEDGIKSQQVDIYYKFIEYINMKELLINGGWCVQDTPEGQKLTLVKLA